MKIIRATTIDRSLSFFEGTMAELMKNHEVQLLSSPGENMDEMCERFGVKPHAIKMNRHISPFKDLESLWKIVKVFRNEKPDMVHSMTPKAGLLCMIAAWVTRVPVRVHTFTGLVWPTATGFKRKLLMTTDKITCACATYIIPEGEGVKRDLLKYHITNKDIHVLGYGNVRGVDMVRFSKRPEVNARAESLRDERLFTFVFVGRIVKDKGINELCSAFERLYESLPNVRLFLVGLFEDDLNPISETARTIVEKNPAVHAVGAQYGDDLLAYYAASDCFVFPSYREGFPNTVLEAGAMDLPSIVTDINGSREIIIEGENGTIVPSKDIDALYSAMERMILDEQWRNRMITNARKMIADRFERSFVQKCLMDFYDEVLK